MEDSEAIRIAAENVVASDDILKDLAAQAKSARGTAKEQHTKLKELMTAHNVDRYRLSNGRSVRIKSDCKIEIFDD